MCRECINSVYYNSMKPEKLHIEILYDIVIKNYLGEIKQTLYKARKWAECREIFNDLTTGKIIPASNTSEQTVCGSNKYTVEVIVNNDIFAFY